MIAAWIFTHGHVDHTGVFSEFFDLYSDYVTIEQIIYNFPSENIISFYDPFMVTSPVLLLKFYNELEFVCDEYPNVEIIKAHTGYKFYIRDAVIEILYTHEDFAATAFGEINETSMVFSIEIEAQKIMILGDINNGASSILNSMYGSYLKSDFLQVAHHGYNYGSHITITYICRSAVCFFPYWANDMATLANYSSNYYLLNYMNVEETYISYDGTVTLTLPYIP